MGSEGFALDVSPGFDALREALVNMLMHSDHFSPGCPRIRIFTDHIEFYNPGGMPKPIDELKGKDISLPRNPIITKLFRVVKLAENAGYGLDNMEYNWKKYNQSIPHFDVTFDAVIVQFQLSLAQKQQEINHGTDLDLLKTLRRKFGSISEKTHRSSEENLAELRGLYKTFIAYLQQNNGETYEKLSNEYGETLEEHQRRNAEKKIFMLMLIIVDNYVSAEDVAGILGISLSTVKRYFKELIDFGIIERTGSDKAGSWSFINKPKI